MPKGFHRGKNTSNRRTDRFIEDNVVQNERVYYSMLSSRILKIFNWLNIVINCMVWIVADHDSRETSEKQKFRQNFKSGRIDRNRPRPVDNSKLQRIIEQDVDMAGSSSHGDSHHRQ